MRCYWAIHCRSVAALSKRQANILTIILQTFRLVFVRLRHGAFQSLSDFRVFVVILSRVVDFFIGSFSQR
jgi:hypothetical protein